MLQKIREKVQGWIAGFITAIIAVAFVLFGLQYYIKTGSGEQVIAKVNGQKVTSQQLAQASKRLEHDINKGRPDATESPDMRKQIQAAALQQLIGQIALLQEAKKQGFNVSIDQVKQLVLSVPQFQENGHFSPQRFQQILYANQASPTEFYHQIQSSLTIEQVASGIQHSAFVLPHEMKQSYGLVKQKRDFNYLVIPSSPFMASVSPTQQEMADYYNQHKDHFKTQEQAQVNYIVLSPDAIRAKINIAESRLQHYYQENKENYKTPSGAIKPFAEVKDEIATMLSRQQVDKLFSEQSEKLADLTYTNSATLSPAAQALGLKEQLSPMLTRSGEKSGVFSNPKVLAAIFSNDVLQQQNNSTPIELKDNSLVVLRVANHIPSKIQSLDEVKGKIEEKLRVQIAKKKAGLRAFQLQKALEQGTITPQALAQKNHLTWQQKQLVMRDDKTIPAAVVTAAFQLISTEKQSKPVTSALLPGGNYAIIQLQAVHLADYDLASTEEIEQLRTNMENYWGDTDYNLYATGVIKQAKVKMMPNKKSSTAS